MEQGRITASDHPWKIRGVTMTPQLTICFSTRHHRLPLGPAAHFLMGLSLFHRPRDGHEAVRLLAFFARISRPRRRANYCEFLMQLRIDVTKASPAAYRAVAALQTYVD